MVITNFLIATPSQVGSSGLSQHLRTHGIWLLESLLTQMQLIKTPRDLEIEFWPAGLEQQKEESYISRPTPTLTWMAMEMPIWLNNSSTRTGMSTGISFTSGIREMIERLEFMWSLLTVNKIWYMTMLTTIFLKNCMFTLGTICQLRHFIPDKLATPELF